MILRITEVNSWEQERWSYYIDTEKQSCGAMNALMVFIRVANRGYEEVKEAAGNHIFAASRYDFAFTSKNKIPTRFSGSYKSGGDYTDAVISPARMKSAMVTMRDKRENKLYKGFESIFLKRKQPALI